MLRVIWVRGWLPLHTALANPVAVLLCTAAPRKASRCSRHGKCLGVRCDVPTVRTEYPWWAGMYDRIQTALGRVALPLTRVYDC